MFVLNVQGLPYGACSALALALVLPASMFRLPICASMLESDALSDAFESSIGAAACTLAPATAEVVGVAEPGVCDAAGGVAVPVLLYALPDVVLLQPAATKNTAAARKKTFFIVVCLMVMLFQCTALGAHCPM